MWVVTIQTSNQGNKNKFFSTKEEAFEFLVSEEAKEEKEKGSFFFLDEE